MTIYVLNTNFFAYHRQEYATKEIYNFSRPNTHYFPDYFFKLVFSLRFGMTTTCSSLSTSISVVKLYDAWSNRTWTTRCKINFRIVWLQKIRREWLDNILGYVRFLRNTNFRYITDLVDRESLYFRYCSVCYTHRWVFNQKV